MGFIGEDKFIARCIRGGILFLSAHIYYNVFESNRFTTKPYCHSLYKLLLVVVSDRCFHL